MYAIVKTGGKQYRVEAGATLTVEKLDGAPESTVELTEVLTGAGLTPAEADEVAVWWGVTQPGNFEGHNILHVSGFSLGVDKAPGRGMAAAQKKAAPTAPW